MITVLVADDHSIVREGVRRLIEGESDIKLCGEAADGREVLEQVEKQRPDVVILDIRMAGMDGIEALQRILDMDNTIPVILNTAYSSFRENYLSWSADAYITKSSDTTELLVKVKELLDAKMVEN